jgi:hypothetical protein
MEAPAALSILLSGQAHAAFLSPIFSHIPMLSYPVTASIQPRTRRCARRHAPAKIRMVEKDCCPGGEER